MEAVLGWRRVMDAFAPFDRDTVQAPLRRSATKTGQDSCGSSGKFAGVGGMLQRPAKLLCSLALSSGFAVLAGCSRWCRGGTGQDGRQLG